MNFSVPFYCPACCGLLQYTTARVKTCTRNVVYCRDCPLTSELSKCEETHWHLEDVANVRLEDLSEPQQITTPLTRTAKSFDDTRRES
jgi:hypothetical protein